MTREMALAGRLADYLIGALASNATIIIPVGGEAVEGARLAAKVAVAERAAKVADLLHAGDAVNVLRRKAAELLLRKARLLLGAGAKACGFCFPAGTQVATPQGEQAIQTLGVGATVLAEDPKTGKVEAEPVQAVIQDPVSPLMAVTLSDGSAITVTADHPFWLDISAQTGAGGWIAAGQLQAGDHLRTASGRDVLVTGLRQHAGQAAVYTLSLRFNSEGTARLRRTAARRGMTRGGQGVRRPF